MKFLVIAAHPDDEVLGCGGTIARLKRENHEVQVAILGEGITSRYDTRDQAVPGLIKNLHLCSRKAAKQLGIEKVELFNLPDNRFDTVPLLDIIKIIENLVVQFQPETIFTHHPGDLNIDHTLTSRAVLTATRPLKGQTVKDIYAFEAPSSTEWAFKQTGHTFVPNLFYDISSTMQNKIDAMQEYDSEIMESPHPRSAEALRTRARMWGSIVGKTSVEAFELVRSIR